MIKHNSGAPAAIAEHLLQPNKTAESIFRLTEFNYLVHNETTTRLRITNSAYTILQKPAMYYMKAD
jgi:hypothetical protein